MYSGYLHESLENLTDEYLLIGVMFWKTSQTVQKLYRLDSGNLLESLQLVN